MNFKALLFVVSVSTALALAGQSCGPECPPEEDVTVTLQQDLEDVRTFPLIATGKRKLLDVDVPEAHGNIQFSVQVEGAPDVVIDDFTFTQTVDGAQKQIELVSSTYGDADFEEGTVVQDGGKFRFIWRMRELAEYVLPEGKPHASKVELSWRRAGCRTQTGVATLDVAGTVKGANELKNFVLAAAEGGRLHPANGMKAKFSLQSPYENDLVWRIGNPTFTATFFSQGNPPLIGLGIAQPTNIAIQMAGVSKRQIAAGETLDVFTSSNPSVGNAPYDNAGQSSSETPLVGGGKLLVTLRIESEKASSSTGAVEDVIHALVDAP